MNKRKICFIITSKIHYGRSKMILRRLQEHPDIELQIIVGASAILPNYGDILTLMKKDGFAYNAKITMTFEGGTPVAMAKTAGIGITEFATAFENLQPDIVIVRADRYEVLSAAIAAAYMNIPVAHIEGGDLSGTIDESVRHAITKLAHIHFATNDEAKNRILRLGENPKYVFNFGSPELEFVHQNGFEISQDLVNYVGVGADIDLNKPYMIVMQHPVTTEVGDNRKNIEETLIAVYESNVQCIWFWPNIDAGTDEVSKAIRVFREKNDAKNMRFIKFIPAEEFTALLRNSAVLVGNSSAGIKEASFMGVPVVNIGTRQQGRHRGQNVVDVPYDRKEIKKAIDVQVAHGKYEPNLSYYQQGTSKSIVDTLVNIDLYIQKRFYE